MKRDGLSGNSLPSPRGRGCPLMIKAVADSGPFMHLAVVNHVALLQRYFQPLLILPQVYDEVVTQGLGRPGAPELAAACDSRIVQRVELANRDFLDQVQHLPS